MSVSTLAAVPTPQDGGLCKEVSDSCTLKLAEDGGMSEVSTECAAPSPGGISEGMEADADAFCLKEQEAETAAPAQPVASRKLPALPAPGALEGVKSKKRTVLSVGLSGSCEGKGDSEAALCLGSRVALAGLSEGEAADLIECLTEDKADGIFRTTRHEHLRVSALRDGSEEQLVAAAALAPHVVCVRSQTLKANKAACSVLRNFKGALLVVEPPSLGPNEAEDSEDEQEVAMLLHALGVTGRFALTDAGLESVAVPSAPVGEVIGDLKVKDLERNPELAELAEQAQPLYDEFFHEDMMDELRGWEDIKIAFLVNSVKTSGAKPELLGFIVYKFWGAPLRAMSILRVAVPHKYRMMGFGKQLVKWSMERAKQKPRHECAKVTLCAMPEAIAFYDRLNFKPIPEEDLFELPEEEGVGERLPGAVWMEFKCGRSYKPSGRKG